jgi:phage-related protein
LLRVTKLYKILYGASRWNPEKGIRWVGSAYEDLLAFPQSVRRHAGFQLGKVQAGLDPDVWKPFGQVGIGVREIRIRDARSAFRVLYVTSPESVYVLHCFQKKTRTTSRRDKDIAGVRYRAVMNQRISAK